MASSSKTSRLGLSLWEASDRPERLDFRQDNEKLESLVGVHIKDAMKHLTTAEKERVQRPYDIYTYTGDGKSQRSYYYNFTPSLALVFAVGKPPVQQREGGVDIYCAVAIGMNSTAGMSMESSRLLLFQQTESQAQNGMRLRLNESGVSYVLAMIH